MDWRCSINYFKILVAALLFCLSVEAENIKFQEKTILLGKNKLTVEMATTDAQQMRGLMFRKSLKENHGMLFVYSNEKTLNFWMKNTFIPLSIGFFDKSKKLIDVQDMKATSSIMQEKVDQCSSSKPAMYALEIDQGWFTKHKVSLGERFEFQ